MPQVNKVKTLKKALLTRLQQMLVFFSNSLDKKNQTHKERNKKSRTKNKNRQLKN